MNQSYLEDEDGNITQRQDGNLGLTESFFYDKDNRLTCASLSGSCGTPTFVYDAGAAGPGNITTQTGVGTYTYPAAGQPRPHAVTGITGTFNGITNPSFAYDANGNMTARASSSANIVWSSYNYPTSISAVDATGTEATTFQYGPDRQRWQYVYNGPSGTKTYYYVGQRLEVAFIAGETYYRHYIYAGSKPVAVYIRNSDAGITMSYLSMDHEGSVSAITTNTGGVGADESFAAFGARRNSSTWSGPPTSANMSAIANYTRQGYTFQTWLGESMGLNHMNGRVQDAILGRMISPDPHITDPTNAQSYNRYSYVNNNPLTFVDPTGFDDKFCPETGCGGGIAMQDPLAGLDLGPTPSVSVAPATYNTGSMIPGYTPNFCSGCSLSSGGGNSGTTATGGTANDGGAAASGISTQTEASAQSQGGVSIMFGPTAINTFPDGTQMTVDLNSTSSDTDAAETVSTVAGWVGLGAANAEPALGDVSLGSNYRFYSAPRGNQYFHTLFKLGTAAHVIGVGGLVVGTAADYYQAVQTGSYFQANLNLGIGAAGLLLPPLALPGSFYLSVSQMYPGGQGAYNAAFSGAINAAEGGGP